MFTSSPTKLRFLLPRPLYENVVSNFGLNTNDIIRLTIIGIVLPPTEERRFTYKVINSLFSSQSRQHFYVNLLILKLLQYKV